MDWIDHNRFQIGKVDHQSTIVAVMSCLVALVR
jgi:hypothetical protein